MRGIYANGLEMPKNCRMCNLRRIYQHMKPSPCPAVSSSLVAHGSDAKQRREGCPLIEIPDGYEPLKGVRLKEGQIEILPEEVVVETIDIWVPIDLKQPPKPTGPEWYSFEGVDIAADEYNVMIEGATFPTSAHWTGSCWFDPYDPTGQLLPVIAWRRLPDPPSWALKDQNHEEGGPPFPEVMP